MSDSMMTYDPTHPTPEAYERLADKIGPGLVRDRLLKAAEKERARRAAPGYVEPVKETAEQYLRRITDEAYGVRPTADVESDPHEPAPPLRLLDKMEVVTSAEAVVLTKLLDVPLTWNEIKPSVGIRQGAAYEALNALVERGIVERRGSGKPGHPYRYTRSE